MKLHDSRRVPECKEKVGNDSQQAEQDRRTDSICERSGFTPAHFHTLPLFQQRVARLPAHQRNQFACVSQQRGGHAVSVSVVSGQWSVVSSQWIVEN